MIGDSIHLSSGIIRMDVTPAEADRVAKAREMDRLEREMADKPVTGATGFQTAEVRFPPPSKVLGIESDVAKEANPRERHASAQAFAEQAVSELKSKYPSLPLARSFLAAALELLR